MEEGTKAKRTIFVGGLGSQINEDALVAAFSTFGDIVDAQIPSDLARDNTTSTYRGIAFLTYATSPDAADAIDNMDMSLYAHRVIRVSVARPIKGPAALGGGLGNRAIWESEEWLKANAGAVEGQGGQGAGGGGMEEGGTGAGAGTVGEAMEE